MSVSVLSLDISASSTGWAYAEAGDEFKIYYGLITTKAGESRAKRLYSFKQELTNLLLTYKPTHIVIEDVFSGLNVKTLKLLAKFAGVAEACCMDTLSVEPYVISTNTVKSYFKAKKKKILFDFILSLLEWDTKRSFAKYNDITDAIAQLLCYYDHVLHEKTFRYEKEYGYLYEVNYVE